MRIAARWAICAVAFVAMGGSGGARAQALSAQPPDIQEFVKQYVAAWNAKDVGRVHALSYSKSAACITPASRDFYDGVLMAQMRDPIPPNYTVSAAAPNENNLKALESMGFQWPVHPVRELHINYQQGDDVGGSDLWLVRENGRWVYDFPCATEASLKKFHDDAAENERVMAHYKALATGIKEPLRSELVDLLRKHETATAIDRYQAASGQDMKTSMYVINALKEEAR